MCLLVHCLSSKSPHHKNIYLNTHNCGFHRFICNLGNMKRCLVCPVSSCILQNYRLISHSKYWHWYNPPILFRLPWFYLYLCVCVCTYVNCVQYNFIIFVLSYVPTTTIEILNGFNATGTPFITTCFPSILLPLQPVIYLPFLKFYFKNIM